QLAESGSESLRVRGEVRGNRRLEGERAAVSRVHEGQTVRVKRLALELNRAQFVGAGHVSFFAHERVAAQARLNADLITPSRPQTDLDQRRATKSLEYTIVADGFARARIARRGLRLNERFRVPDEMIAPGAGL